MDIYDIAVKLALIDGVSGGLTQIAQQLTNVRASIGGTRMALLSFRAAFNASWEWQGREKILHGMADIIDAGGEILGQQTLMLAAARKQADVAKLTAAAYRVAAPVMAATSASALKAERALLGIFGNEKAGQAARPSFLKAGAVLAAAGRGAGAERRLADGLKALDSQGAFANRKTGQFDAAALKAETRELVALSPGIPCTLDMKQLMPFTPMAGPAGQAMSFPDYAHTYGKAIASMVRTGGRGLQILYIPLLGGDISNALADELARAGLAKPGAVRHIRGSSRDILDYRSIVDWQELTANAADRARDVLFPMLAEHGFKGVPGLMGSLGDPVAIFAMPMIRDLAGDIKSLPRILEDNPEVAGILGEIGGSLGAILTVRGLRVGRAALKLLAGADGLGGLAHGFGLFGAGSISATGLKLLIGPTGPFALAVGIDALGKALPSILAWPTRFATKQATDVARAKLMKLPGALGMPFDLGGDTNQPWLKERLLTEAPQAGAIMEFRAHHTSARQWLPTFVSPHRVNSALPLPPGAFISMTPALQAASALPLPPLLPARGAPAQITIHSAPNVTLPLPPMSPGDIACTLQRVLIQGLHANTLGRIADELAKRQADALDPLLQKALEKHFADAAHKHETHLKRRSLLDFSGIPAFGTR